VTAQDREHRAEKADRALRMHEDGFERWIIATRLGVPPHNVNGMIQRARQRRERLAGEVEA
jgi:DNA-binding transcriptional regulator LsrR (DeoR family)